MKRLIMILVGVAFFLALGALGAAIFAQETEPEPAREKYADWDEQLCELGYRLFANSSINVIYGVNLTKEQAQKLRKLAKEVEAKGIKKPETSGDFAPEVNKVRKTFMEIQETLFEKKEVTKELEAKLVEARKLESDILRRGLTAPVWGQKYGSCRRCHAEPRITDGKITYDTTAKKWKAMGRKVNSPAVKKEMGVAHLGAVLRDMKGFRFMGEMGEKVAKILTDNHKEVVGKFSCCLIPPKSLSDPVRVGQADLAEWQVEMLEKARKCPDGWWPAAKKRTLDALQKGALIADPGMTEKKMKEERKRVGDILEKARSLSDVDFEMEKENLAAQIKVAMPETPEHLRNFNSAFFLLMPGAVKVYDKLIEHLDKQKSLDEGDEKEEK